jgi:RNA polymerase sigma factor (sigma-70 family)
VTFDETFDAMYEPLARYCYRLGGDRDVAEDIAQEAMVRFFERGIEGSEAGVRSWLFKTATHLVRDRYRVEENRKRLLQETPVTPMPPSTPEQSLEVNETRAMARSALNVLPERDKEMLLLRYSGFSYREIADVLDVAATSVGTLLCRAEQKFSTALETTGGTQ